MTDLDAELRATFQSPPDFVVRSLDFDHIMKAGTRRRRIRTAARGVVTVAVLAVFVGGLQTSGILDRSHRDSTPAVTVTSPPSPIITTGLKAGRGREWVIKTVSVKIVGSKKKIFGFSMNEQATNGKLTQDLVTSEVDAGTELKPGFHAPEHAYNYAQGSVQPAYGYFVGTPAKITGTVGGKTVTARTAPSSVGPSVIVFWFDNTEVTQDSKLTRVTAYDAAGKRLDQARVYTEGQ